MKKMLLVFLFSIPAFAAETSFTNFSGQWKGECFRGTDYYSSSVSILQADAESITISMLEWRPDDQKSHSLTGDVVERYESHADQDDMGPEQFLEGTSQWDWCKVRDKIRICNKLEWYTWESTPENKTFFNGTTEMRIVSGKLEIKYRELYRPSENSNWLTNTERFCRYEK